MTYLLITIIIVLIIILKLKQLRNIKEQIDWIQQIVSSDGHVSDNEKEKIIEFATRKQLYSSTALRIFLIVKFKMIEKFILNNIILYFPIREVYHDVLCEANLWKK